MSDGEAVLISQALTRWKCDLVDVSYDMDAQEYLSDYAGDPGKRSVKRSLHPA